MWYKDEGETLRKELSEHRATSKAHFPKALKQLTGEFIQRCRDQGLRVREIEVLLGLKWPTLCRWVPDFKQSVVMLPVVLGSAPGECGLSLTTPSGYRVEGLSPAVLVELLRSLS